MSTKPKASPAAVAAVAKFSQILADPKLRKSFAGDPRGTLKQEGINDADIPANVLKTLEAMSEAELDQFAKISAELIRAGLYIHVPGIGSLCYL